MSWEPQTSVALRDFLGLYRDSFTWRDMTSGESVRNLAICIYCVKLFELLITLNSTKGASAKIDIINALTNKTNARDVYKDYFCISQKAQHACITKTSRLIQCSKTFDVYCKNYERHVNRPCVKSGDSFNLPPGVIGLKFPAINRMCRCELASAGTD